MALYQHILLAADLTQENSDTVQKAREMAKLFGAKLSLLHVVEPIPNYGFVGITDIEDKLVEEAKLALTKLGKEIMVPEADQWVAIGNPKREILASAKELNVDLIILGSHTGIHFSEILGSTTNGVLHHSHCDVLTVRHNFTK